MATRRGRSSTRLQRGQGNEGRRDSEEGLPILSSQPEPVAPPAEDNVSARALQGILQFIQQQGAGNPRATGPETSDRMLERFLKFNPPAFHGDVDDVKAEYWLDKMEQIFTTLEHTEAQQVTDGTFLLEGAARNWWRTVKERWEQEDTAQTWTNFVQEFRDQYVPQIVRKARRDKLHKLQQGTKTVSAYEAGFHRLSRYTPSLVADEGEKIYKFVRGLRTTLNDRLLAQEQA